MEFEDNKVYIVTEGEYSDYGIVAAFSTMELARKFLELNGVDLANYDNNSSYYSIGIEVYKLDQLEFQLREGYKAYHVLMQKNGDSIVSEMYWLSRPPTTTVTFTYEWQNYAPTGRCVLSVEILAKSKEAAVKVANEKRAQLIASGEWDVTDEKAKQAREQWLIQIENSKNRYILRGY